MSFRIFAKLRNVAKQTQDDIDTKVFYFDITSESNNCTGNV